MNIVRLAACALAVVAAFDALPAAAACKGIPFLPGSISPKTVEPGASFEALCDTGGSHPDCIGAQPGNCRWVGWVKGGIGRFSCRAPSDEGSYPITCVASAGTKSNCCANTRTIETLVVRKGASTTPTPTPTPGPCQPRPNSCSAPSPACGKTTTGRDSCGNACSLSGPACTCRTALKTYAADFKCNYILGTGSVTGTSNLYQVSCGKEGAWKTQSHGTCIFSNSPISGCRNTCPHDVLAANPTRPGYTPAPHDPKDPPGGRRKRIN